ncbi:hypothetical protein DL766_006187 [Monosporascus sp. MC13-8B]|uniref:Uncharacterized protein n=1 Tax=Monosporascus cannonballus TaxID=155416 RepID=A0ABY0GW55_9PEZI|nr:hypothetical protein DL762_008541 [Monosporascus cannonballus]RYO79704.1 hypothetical protein DL763_009174 [Monosporascus cannonballus]RYP27812.1 hypothetical protein DL766_006187 [Monosporascus sp. MC13-8B]
MAHSPLFRTIMRIRLDARAVELTRYEREMEDICTERQGLKHAAAFDAEAWHDYRKRHELKARREARAARREEDLRRRVDREDRRIQKPLARVLRYSKWDYPRKKGLDQRAKGELPPARSVRPLKMLKVMKLLEAEAPDTTTAPGRKGYCNWRPTPLCEILRAEGVVVALSPPTRRGTPGGLRPEGDRGGSGAPTGSLDPRALRAKLTPDYVPKPHLRRARRRLLEKSAEFAELVGRGFKLPVAGGGLSDDSSDADDSGSDDDGKPLLDKRKRKAKDDAGGSTGTGAKRQRNGFKKTTARQAHQKRPPRAVAKTFDSVVYDALQLRAEARSRFCLVQQSLPRVEQPPWGSAKPAREETGEEGEDAAAARKAKIGPNGAADPDAAPRETAKAGPTAEEKALERLKAIGAIKLPTRIPVLETRPEGEAETQGESELTGEIGLEEARRYRKWRWTTAKALFTARDRYMRCRVYRERAQEKGLIRAVKDLLEYWKRA